MTLNIIWAKREMAAAAAVSEVSIFYCYLLYNIIIDRYIMIIMRENLYSISYYRLLPEMIMMSTSLPPPTSLQTCRLIKYSHSVLISQYLLG